MNSFREEEILKIKRYIHGEIQKCDTNVVRCPKEKEEWLARGEAAADIWKLINSYQNWKGND